MRAKLIALFSVIVLVVGGLSLALMRVTVGPVVINPARARTDAKRASASAQSELRLQALTLERWLDVSAASPGFKEVFLVSTPKAKSAKATEQCNKVFESARGTFKEAPPSLVAMVNAQGVVLGRNGSELMRGDELGKAYTGLAKVLKQGGTGSALWISPKRHEQMLVAYATLRDKEGKIAGALVLGSPIDDGLLSKISERSSGRSLLLGYIGSGKPMVIAKSSAAALPFKALIEGGAMAAAVKGAVKAPRPQDLNGAPKTQAAAGSSLGDLGTQAQAFVVAVAPNSEVKSLWSLLWPIIGSTALGAILVFVCSQVLSQYYDRALVEMEQGMLAIMNGQTNRRLETDHDEFGGVATMINSLLNTLMGVAEDHTDDEGRPSTAPSQVNYQAAMNVGASGGAKVDAAAATALKNEPAEQYYQRLFDEYIAAKRELGDKVDHITKDAFVTRIKGSEKQSSDKHGTPVRFKVEKRPNEVRLIAVTLE